MQTLWVEDKVSFYSDRSEYFSYIVWIFGAIILNILSLSSNPLGYIIMMYTLWVLYRIEWGW